MAASGVAGTLDTMLLKVSARSSPNAVAGAIAGVLRERGAVYVQVIGAGALNQAVKAIAIARSFVNGEGLDPVCVPEFQDIDVGGESRTAIRMLVQDCNKRDPMPPPAESAPILAARHDSQVLSVEPPIDA